MGFLDSLTNGLTKGAAIATPVGAIAQGIGQVASLIPRPNYNKIEATGAQQNIETAAKQIESLVNSGQMDVDAGLAALDALERRVIGLSGTGDKDYLRGANTAGIIIGNIRANFQTKKTAAMNQPIGEGGLTGSVNAQQGQFATALRNALAGHDTSNLAATPAGAVLKPGTNPLDNLGPTAGKVNEFFPTPDNTDFSSQIKAALSRYAQPKTQGF